MTLKPSRPGCNLSWMYWNSSTSIWSRDPDHAPFSGVVFIGMLIKTCYEWSTTRLHVQNLKSFSTSYEDNMKSDAKLRQVSKLIWEKTASPSCNPSATNAFVCRVSCMDRHIRPLGQANNAQCTYEYVRYNAPAHPPEKCPFRGIWTPN